MVKSINVKSLILLFLTITSSGFLGCAYQKKIWATRASYSYNHALKWKEVDDAAAYLSRENKVGLIKIKRNLEKNLDLIDFEIMDAIWNKKEGIVIIKVRKKYVLYPDNTYKEKVFEEKWKKEGGKWIVLTPFTIYNEKPKKANNN